MMTEIVVSAMLLTGSLFMLLAAIGILRMPDLYTRMGTSTKAATLGLVCILTAVAVRFSSMETSTRAIAAVAFVFLTAPIAAHMIGRAAYVVGVPLWDGTVVDELRDRERQLPRPPADARKAERIADPAGDDHQS